MEDQRSNLEKTTGWQTWQTGKPDKQARFLSGVRQARSLRRFVAAVSEVFNLHAVRKNHKHAARLFRPWRDSVGRPLFPSDESLGYFQPFLRDKKLALSSRRKS